MREQELNETGLRPRGYLFVCVHRQFMTGNRANENDIVLPATQFLVYDDIYKGRRAPVSDAGAKLVEAPARRETSSC
ncbi:MAG: hypothetical protein HPM95_17165 [Alphaproteobacteria bacterium]|nr:hypothetical protein [Alphaproteobacteria bacterium]